MAERGELEPGQPHPSTASAIEYIMSIPLQDLCVLLESYSTCAIEGNELAEVCASTLRRIMDEKPVGDRYLLGLAWNIRAMREPLPGFSTII